MIYRKLGNTDLEVSAICLGTMTFGEQNTESEAHTQLSYALEKGINFIDSAELYSVPSTRENNGLTEQYIGSWLKETGNRDKVILATKVTGPSSNLYYVSENLGFSRPRILEAIDKSLKRLQTDYIDLYQFHWPERKTNYFGQRGYTHHDSKWEDNFLEGMETIDDLITAGKIRAFGISNETPWGLHRFLSLAAEHNLPKVVSIQNPYNLLNRLFEVGLAEMAIRENCGLLAYSPMGFGLLSGKYHTKKATQRSRLNKYSQMSRYNSAQSYEATKKYMDIAGDEGLALAQMSLAFVNNRPFVTSTIIGATDLNQLKENIDSIDIKLSKEVIKKIDSIHAQIPNPAP